MRISSSMQQRNELAVLNSETYKKFKAANTKTETTETPADATVKTETKQISKDTILEKTGDKLTISRIDQNNKKTTLQELSMTSENGKRLAEMVGFGEGSNLDSCLKDLKSAKQSMSLANYLK